MIILSRRSDASAAAVRHKVTEWSRRWRGLMIACSAGTARSSRAAPRSSRPPRRRERRSRASCIRYPLNARSRREETGSEGARCFLLPRRVVDSSAPRDVSLAAISVEEEMERFRLLFSFFLCFFVSKASLTVDHARCYLHHCVCVRVYVCVYACVCCCAGRGCSRRGYAVDERGHSGRQKLREDPLHQRQHLLLRCWHCSRH